MMDRRVSDRRVFDRRVFDRRSAIKSCLALGATLAVGSNALAGPEMSELDERIELAARELMTPIRDKGMKLGETFTVVFEEFTGSLSDKKQDRAIVAKIVETAQRDYSVFASAVRESTQFHRDEIGYLLRRFKVNFFETQAEANEYNAGVLGFQRLKTAEMARLKKAVSV